jgi:tetratricopeptide (TPR) repeat protein
MGPVLKLILRAGLVEELGGLGRRGVPCCQMARFGSKARNLAALGLVLGATLLIRTELAMAQEPAAATQAPVAPAPASQAKAAEVRRDPAGKTGISPVAEAIARGDAALLARDFPAATAAYQEAIKADPKKAIGHLRMASLHLVSGELDQATVVLETAERFTAGDARLTIQVLALKAMLLERRAAWEDAGLAWSAYAMLGRAGGAAVADSLLQDAIMTTCAERKTKVAAVPEREAAYAKVRQRIEKGLAEAEPSSVPTVPAPAAP